MAAATAAAGLLVMPAAVHADDGDALIDVDLPIVVCGVGSVVTGSGACPTTPPPTGSPIDINPAALGTTGSNGLPPLIDANVPVVVCGNGVPVFGTSAAACPSTLAPPTESSGSLNAAVPLTVCGNGVGVGALSTAGCPAQSAGVPAGSSPLNPGLVLLTCGTSVAVLDDAQGTCATGPGTGNDVGLPGGLDDTVGLLGVVDAVGSTIGSGRAIDAGGLVEALGLGAVVDPTLEVDACGVAGAVASPAAGGCSSSNSPQTPAGPDGPGGPGSPGGSGSGSSNLAGSSSGASLPLTGAAALTTIAALAAAFVGTGMAGRVARRLRLPVR